MNFTHEVMGEQQDLAQAHNWDGDYGANVMIGLPILGIFNVGLLWLWLWLSRLTVRAFPSIHSRFIMSVDA